MKKKVFIGLLLIISGFANAQTADTIKNKTSIIINIVDLNLEGYNGGIGFKRMLNENYAIIAGMNFSYIESNEDEKDGENFEDEYLASTGFTIDVIKYTPIIEDLKFYVGGGTGFSYTYHNRKYTNNERFSTYETTSNSISIRLNALFGFEYKLNETFALSLQQLISGSHSFSKTKSNVYYENEFYEESKTESNNKSFNIGLGSSYLSLLIYF